jgi:hypothetical protein
MVVQGIEGRGWGRWVTRCGGRWGTSCVITVVAICCCRWGETNLEDKNRSLIIL